MNIKDDIVKNIVDKVTSEFKDKDLFAPEMPHWLTSLPPGRYTVADLIDVSGTGERNIQKTMKKFCKQIEYIESSAPHIKKCLYYWG